MIVYKFGGASVKDKWGIENLGKIVAQQNDNLVVVVSALGKTTNALEQVLELWNGGNDGYWKALNDIASQHRAIISSLGIEGIASEKFEQSVAIVSEYLRGNKPDNYDRDYDQVISHGELWSSLIISEYLNSCGISNKWIDIRFSIHTDSSHRDANIEWDSSEEAVRGSFSFSDAKLYITQGFIGGAGDGITTTLGREGSDYTAAVIANMLNAETVVVWKDVPGLLNSDPRWLADAQRLPVVSYKEAVEMSFSGAKIIHPKTIKPLHNKGIPLKVKSFIDVESEGTLIWTEPDKGPQIPVYVRKESQIMISVLPKDFSFAMGDSLAAVFDLFKECGVKINMVQASAVSINVCADHEKHRVDRLLEILPGDYETTYNENVELLTVRHYTPHSLERVTSGKEVLVEQKTRTTVRYVIRSDDKAASIT